MIQINQSSSQPIFEQIITQIKQGVLRGHLKPGDPIPSVRKMALQLSVTPGTVAKAYNELERQEVIVTLRGKGTYIAEPSTNRPAEIQVTKAMKTLEDACMELIYLGITEEEMKEKIHTIYKQIK